jgi:4-hydroxybenzoate polyprenyltransferase
MPILQTYGFEISHNNISIVLLIVATIFIAAGGYVLNDYFDVKIDRINRPDSVVVTNEISKSMAMTLHQVLTAVGILSGLALAYMSSSLTFVEYFKNSGYEGTGAKYNPLVKTK